MAPRQRQAQAQAAQQTRQTRQTRQARQPWAARTERDRTEAHTRALLLEAAERVFARRGYGRTTVADIAAEADVSRAGFYVYFASKAEVFRVLAGRVRDAFLAAQEVPGTDPDDPHAVARDSVGAFIAAYAAHLPLLALFEQQALADEEVARLWSEIHRRPLHRHAKYVRRLAEAGLADPVVEPLALARAVGAMSTQSARLVAEDPGAYEAAVRDVTTMYLHLLRVTEDTAAQGTAAPGTVTSGTVTPRARAESEPPDADDPGSARG
ncbi:TetR/AcrR family transcriptional regulator [Streptomyces sp. NPDC054796]